MYIFDLDGTLADCAHRRPLVEGVARKEPDSWKQFYKACVFDTPITPVIDILRILYRYNWCEIWSGREASVERQTLNWLYNNHVPYNKLLMRPVGDTRSDVDLKAEWLATLRKESPQREVHMVFDDRNKMVAFWRSQGIVCAQVAEGNF